MHTWTIQNPYNHLFTSLVSKWICNNVKWNNTYFFFIPVQWGRCLVWRFAPCPPPTGAWPPTCTARYWQSPSWSFGRTSRTQRHWSEAPPHRTHCTSQTRCVVLFVFHPCWTQMRWDLSARKTNLRLSTCTCTQTHKNTKLASMISLGIILWQQNVRDTVVL